MVAAFIIMGIGIYAVVAFLYKKHMNARTHAHTEPKFPLKEIETLNRITKERQKQDDFLLDNLIFNIEVYKQKEQGKIVVYHNSLQ